MAIQFQRNYQLLELDNNADWKTANKNYRRLVHTWHPDRFEQRPRERIHAQQQFIELTKAFNNLRGFYRENNRLPFEKIQHAKTAPSSPPIEKRVMPSDELVLESGILNKRKPSTSFLKSDLFHRVLWALPIIAALVVGMAVFVITDRNAKMNTIEEAKRVLRSDL